MIAPHMRHASGAQSYSHLISGLTVYQVTVAGANLTFASLFPLLTGGSYTELSRVRSFVRPFVRSFVRSSFRSSVRSSVLSFVRSFVCTSNPIGWFSNTHKSAHRSSETIYSHRFLKSRNSNAVTDLTDELVLINNIISESIFTERRNHGLSRSSNSNLMSDSVN